MMCMMEPCFYFKDSAMNIPSMIVVYLNNKYEQYIYDCTPCVYIKYGL